MKRILISIAMLVGCVVALTAHAAAIQYTFTGTGADWTLNGTEMTGDFSVVFNTDTTSVDTTSTPGLPSVSGLTGSITLQGAGTATFDSAYVFNNQGLEVVGFGTGDDLYDLVAPGSGLATYDLTTSFGPIGTLNIDAGALSQWVALDTSLGTLTMNAVSEGTFTAATASVPEPATLSLLALGLVGVGLVRRKQKA